jgi:CheY-like chemotaxis protein
VLLAELERALQAKDEFLAILGHELRNPLAPLRNAAEILAVRAADDPAIARIQQIIERQVRHMVRLVDDLLDVSRITRGRVELRRERVAMADVVARAAEAARPLMEERGHELSADLPTEPVTVDGDPVRLEQALGNLLQNAARYTEGHGHIAVSLAREGGEAVIRVTDDGIGIAPEMLERVFELFVQGERPRHRSAEGLGIGLTLVRNLVEIHGGRVSARSEGPGRGSEFIVRLPLAGPAPADAAEARQAIPAKGDASRSHLRVLVVDDNVDAAESLALILRGDGYDVATAHDGASALDKAGETAFDFIILDIALPDDLDGYEVARRIRGARRLPDVTLIALTGFGQEEDRRRAVDAGFDHHLVKPVDPDVVRGLLAPH